PDGLLGTAEHLLQQVAVDLRLALQGVELDRLLVHPAEAVLQALEILPQRFVTRASGARLVAQAADDAVDFGLDLAADVGDLGIGADDARMLVSELAGQ